MSSIGSSTTMVDYLGPNRYRVLDKNDQDGDGVADGKSLAGDQGKVVNESAVNQLLALRGLQAAGGEFRSLDNFSINSSNVGAVSFGAELPLPDVTGPSLPPDVLARRFDWMGNGEGMEDAALMWMALSTLAKTSMQDMHDSKTIKNLLQKGKLDLQKAEINATENRIQKEKDAALSGFIWATVGAVASGVLGSQEGIAGKMATGVSGMLTKFGEFTGKNYGAQAAADYYQVREKVLQQQQTIMDMAIDESKSSYDDSKELFKLALKIMSEHVERQSQVVQSITRG